PNPGEHHFRRDYFVIIGVLSKIQLVRGVLDGLPSKQAFVEDRKTSFNPRLGQFFLGGYEITERGHVRRPHDKNQPEAATYSHRQKKMALMDEIKILQV